MTISDIINRMNDCDYLLEQCVENVEYIKKLSPSSLNTFRFVTFVNNDGSVEILTALLRMGDGRAATDNFTSGGIACPINLDSGRLTSFAQGKENKRFTKHPFSGISFDGYQIQDWENIKETVIEIASFEPEARLVGWDLAQTTNGLVLIEGNIPPGEDIFQIGTGRGMWYEINNRLKARK